MKNFAGGRDISQQQSSPADKIPPPMAAWRVSARQGHSPPTHLSRRSRIGRAVSPTILSHMTQPEGEKRWIAEHLSRKRQYNPGDSKGSQEARKAPAGRSCQLITGHAATGDYLCNKTHQLTPDDWEETDNSPRRRVWGRLGICGRI